MVQKSPPAGPATEAAHETGGSRPGPWRIASEAFGRVRDRLEPTMAGRIWQRLRDLGFISNSLQFAAVFTLGFIPFLNVILTVLGSGLSRAILGFFIAYFASSSISSNEAMYGPIGAVMALVTAEIGLGVALQLGAVIGAASRPGGPGSGRSPAGRSALPSRAR
jgi:hypothetical protein